MLYLNKYKSTKLVVILFIFWNLKCSNQSTAAILLNWDTSGVGHLECLKLQKPALVVDVGFGYANFVLNLTDVTSLKDSSCIDGLIYSVYFFVWDFIILIILFMVNRGTCFSATFMFRPQ